ncbi:SRPBCC family protein [Actinopolymorpha alba]|uniref:SRPBCC family protein n=1 Tax=Actinopolymorpha alba TaxID=533267 RepID=UPI000370D2F6|nr:SRPBCC domain-containing protein [Actinopolymorpha alba]
MTDATLASGVVVESAADHAGFTATVSVPATPDAVFAYFTEPDLFAHWFVVDGYTTPAEEIRLDPRPGGAVTGVMVSDDGSTRIPFDIRYGRVDPPRLAQFTFTEPDEAVTLDVQPMTRGLTRVSYHKPYGNGDDVHGAQSMLDALASSIARAARKQASRSSPRDGVDPVDLAGLIKRLGLPEGFEAPTELRHADLHARAISRVDLEDDVAGINASLDLIRRTRGGRWPTELVTADGNYIDLVWHECEFRDRKSFTYAVYDDDGLYLGCCYLYPVGVRSPLTEALLQHDVDVSWWVTPDAYEAGHYQTLYQALQHWATNAFPFTNPHYSNIEIPKLD